MGWISHLCLIEYEKTKNQNLSNHTWSCDRCDLCCDPACSWYRRTTGNDQ